MPPIFSEKGKHKTGEHDGLMLTPPMMIGRGLRSPVTRCNRGAALRREQHEDPWSLAEEPILGRSVMRRLISLARAALAFRTGRLDSPIKKLVRTHRGARARIWGPRHDPTRLLIWRYDFGDTVGFLIRSRDHITENLNPD